MHNIIVNAVNNFFILMIIYYRKSTCASGHGCVNFRDKFVKNRSKGDFYTLSARNSWVRLFVSLFCTLLRRWRMQPSVTLSSIEISTELYPRYDRIRTYASSRLISGISSDRNCMTGRKQLFKVLMICILSSFDSSVSRMVVLLDIREYTSCSLNHWQQSWSSFWYNSIISILTSSVSRLSSCMVSCSELVSFLFSISDSVWLIVSRMLHILSFFQFH